MPTGDETYTPELARLICERLAAGETLRSICRDIAPPTESTVRRWVLDDVDGFAAQYARAREIGYQCMADELLEEARNPRVGQKRKTKGDGSIEVEEGDAVDRSRLVVDTLKWTLAKALPKIYGEKPPVESEQQKIIIEGGLPED